jgi:hypothetical protein
VITRTVRLTSHWEKSTNNITDFIWHTYLFRNGFFEMKLLKSVRACSGVEENFKVRVLGDGSQKQTD